MCFPLCLTIKKPSLADKSIPQGLFLFPYASNRKLVFLNIFVTGAQSRIPNVHHFQSHIKIWDQMPFLYLHPGPFISPQKLRDNCSTPALQTGEEIICPPPLPLALFGPPEDGRWQGTAYSILADEEISQIASLAVNASDSQQGGITEIDALATSSGDYRSSVPGPTIHPLLCRGSLQPEDLMGLDKSGDLHIREVTKTQKELLKRVAYNWEEQKRMKGRELPGS